MALTNLAAETQELKLWAKEVMRVARKKSEIEKFVGSGEDAMVQKVTELRTDVKGTKAIITLVPNLNATPVVGDATLTGNEASLVGYDQEIVIDQVRQGLKSAGRMTDKKSILNFRKTARNALGQWLSEMIDTMAFLKLSSLPYSRKLDGGTYSGSAGYRLEDLAFANAGGTVPTGRRVVSLQGSAGSAPVWQSGFAATGTLRKLTYADVVNLKAIAKEEGIKPVYKEGVGDLYYLFVTPTGMSQLKLDADFIANVRHAGIRGDKNSLFAGTTSYVMVDGVMVIESFYVFHTRGAAAPNKMGSAGTQEGQRALLCGAQALGYCDLGDPLWDEADVTDYGNQPGIGISKILGFEKFKFKGSWRDAANLQDYGVICVDTAL